MYKFFAKKLNTAFRLVSIFYYQIKIQLIFFLLYKKKNYTNIYCQDLSKNGYVKLKNIIPKDVIDRLLLNYRNQIQSRSNNLTNDGYLVDIPVKHFEVKDFFEYFEKNKVFNACMEYLGKFEILNCKINHQTENDHDSTSMQPHHDTRGNDLKIYVWMSNYNEKSHPLYYLKGSHNDWKFYILEKHHRRKDISKNNMDKIFGDKGDVIIFDTHGWHSHVKKNTAERTVLELTLVPNNYLFRSEAAGQSSFE